VVAKKEGKAFNIFEELDRFRTQMAGFETAIGENSALSWLVQVEIEGPFPNLKAQGIVLMDVSHLLSLSLSLSSLSLISSSMPLFYH